MCKILFSESGNTACVADVLKVEDAVQFALNLHRSSNVKHTIIVRFSDTDNKVESTVLLLERK